MFFPIARLSFSGSIALILGGFTALAGPGGLMVGWIGEWIGRVGYVARGRGGESMISGSILEKFPSLLPRTFFESVQLGVPSGYERFVMLDPWS